MTGRGRGGDGSSIKSEVASYGALEILKREAMPSNFFLCLGKKLCLTSGQFSVPGTRGTAQAGGGLAWRCLLLSFDKLSIAVLVPVEQIDSLGTQMLQ